MRTYGTGSLWLRKSKKHPKGEWWLRYYVGGTQRKEASKHCECCEKRGKSKAEPVVITAQGAGGGRYAAKH